MHDLEVPTAVTAIYIKYGSSYCRFASLIASMFRIFITAEHRFCPVESTLENGSRMTCLMAITDVLLMHSRRHQRSRSHSESLVSA